MTTRADNKKIAFKDVRQRLRRLPGQIKLRERLPVWRLRLIFGALLLTLSELVMWQNPIRREVYEWPVLLALYTALGAIMLDLTARYQAHTPAAVGLVSGLYGLVSSSIINHRALYDIPLGLLVHGMGLQVGAGFLGLMLFVIILRGRRPDLREIGAAAAVGLAWGLWVHWYPVQPSVNWGPVALESAQTYLLIGLAIVGVLFFVVAPRFGSFRETQFALYWWEMIVVGVPLYIAAFVGLIQNVILLPALLLPIAVGAYCVWALRFQQPEVDPSLLAQITFIAPNLITYIILALTFLATGSVSYSLVNGPDSPLGVAIYFVVLGFGTAWLPFASGLIFWMLLRSEYRPKRRRKQ